MPNVERVLHTCFLLYILSWENKEIPELQTPERYGPCTILVQISSILQLMAGWARAGKQRLLWALRESWSSWYKRKVAALWGGLRLLSDWKYLPSDLLNLFIIWCPHPQPSHLNSDSHHLPPWLLNIPTTGFPAVVLPSPPFTLHCLSNNF